MVRLRLVSCIFLTAFLLTIACLLTTDNATATTTGMNGQPIKGKVLETMNTGGYTYLRLQGPAGDIWVAVPETKVQKGQDIVCQPGMTMTNFKSKTLGRSFDSIIFSSGLRTTGMSSMPNPHGGNTAITGKKNGGFNEALQAERSGTTAMGEAMMASGGSASAIVPSKDINVAKAQGENAYTVGECFSLGKKLNNKKIRVRGKVVKVSRMIMGKNWVHIQDGTGNPMENTHDLVVTTMDEPKLNSVVIVEGTLHADKDFGAGYKYKVIIEDAKIK